MPELTMADLVDAARTAATVTDRVLPGVGMPDGTRDQMRVVCFSTLLEYLLAHPLAG